MITTNTPLFTKLAASFLTLLAIGCAQQSQPSMQDTPLPDTDGAMVYGLVCDGSNDTIVIFLREPYNGEDPDTLNILQVSQEHRVFGHPVIGDRIAVLLNDTDSTKADIVIAEKDLLGEWCYKVKPQLKPRAGLDEAWLEEHMSQVADSIQQLLEEEREYGFELKIDSMVMPIGYVTKKNDDGKDLVEYPPLKHYRQWYIDNGRLLLKESIRDSLGQRRMWKTDSTELVVLTHDTLVLRFPDGLQGFYRREVVKE